MSDQTPTLRWCFTHGNFRDPLGSGNSCSASSDWDKSPPECDVRDAVVVPADEPLYRIDPEMHPHYDSPWFIDELEDWKRWGVLIQVYPT